MLEMHLKKINLDRNLTKEDGKTPTDTLLDQFTAKCYELKMSPASIKYLTQEAARIAVLNKDVVDISDLEKALEKFQNEELKN
ncbi:hypothetical protein [Candidatus Phytoplasma solani]|uniref:hypothetical protein n=1 Tax=Candidatus Phytoplasma solani TaxID=69896 RepID=UPI00358ED765